MTTPRFVLTLSLLVATPATALAQIPIGTRVGTVSSVPSGYDDGGRRDPFVSLVVTKTTLPASRLPTRPGIGLAGLVLADVKVTGITKVGPKYFATIEGPDHKSFNVRLEDRLSDATVKSIDADGVVFMETGADPSLGIKPKEVKKTMRRVTEDIR